MYINGQIYSRKKAALTKKMAKWKTIVIVIKNMSYKHDYIMRRLDLNSDSCK